MDPITYIVVAGWVLMYFIPSFPIAAVTAAAMSLLAALLVYLGALDGEHLSVAAFFGGLMPETAIFFLAILLAWPVGVVARRMRGQGPSGPAGV